MFDIGFSEILLIFVLGLVVLGPEKLPRVAAQVGRWIGRARGMARQFREQLEEEVNLEEARKARPPAVTATPPPVMTATPAPAASLPTDSAAAPEEGTATAPSPPWESTAAAPTTPLESATAAPATPSTDTSSPPPIAVAEHASPFADRPSPSAEVAPHTVPQSQAEPEQQVYPDGYSHAHPTDSLGRPIEAPANEPPAVDSGQQDWVGVPAGDVPAGDGGGVSATDKPTQTTPAAAYAPSHERGT
jgi:sec-independent protein translocase protein TatB